MKKLFAKIKFIFTKKDVYEQCWKGEINEDGAYNPVTCKGFPHAGSCAEL